MYRQTGTHTNPSVWSKFSAISPRGIPFSGYFSRISTKWYGALFITEHDGKECSVLVPGMPKTKYPYANKDDELYFPPNTKYYMNEKLDGTNIAFYSLFGEVIAKTRLNPVVNDNIRDFKRMIYDEIPKDYLYNIELAVQRTGYTLCFELWGRRNHHLCYYDQDLQLSFLCAVRSNASLVGRDKYEDIIQTYNFHRPEIIWEGNHTEIYDAYVAYRKDIEKKNKAAEKYVQEGAMIHGDETIWKLKPPSIEEIHRTANKKVGDWFIDAAILKVYENFGIDVLYANGQKLVEDLLLEDFELERVAKSVDAIHKRIYTWTENKKLEDKIKRVVEGKGKTFDSVPSCMRWLSKQLNGKEMKGAYSVVRANELYWIK